MDLLTDEEKFQILLNANNKTLISLCNSNKIFNGICNGWYSERLFKERAKRYYSEYIEYKPEDMKWKKFYISIANLDYYRKNNLLPKLDTTGIDEIEIRDVYIQENEDEFKKLINIYAFNGNVFEVDILCNMTGEVPDRTMLLASAQKGNLEMVQWFTENGIQSPYTFIYAAQDGRINILDYISKIKPNQEYRMATNYAMERQNLPSLLWLEKRGFYPTNIYYTTIIEDLNYDIINFGLRTSTLTQIRIDTLNKILQTKTLAEINKLLKLLFSNGVQVVE